MPSSPPALLASGYFGLGTKFKLLRELLRRPAPVSPDVTMAAFFRERFGAEVVDYALALFVSGVWAGDPDQLLVSETMPPFVMPSVGMAVRNSQLMTPMPCFTIKNKMRNSRATMP